MLFLGMLGVEGGGVYWPTGGEMVINEEVIQGTEEAGVKGGMFGCYRDKGGKFHEGIDIKARRKDGGGEAVDGVYSILGGRVVYVNGRGGDSSYGKYVVIEHEGLKTKIYSLYAHLAYIEDGIRVGRYVHGNEKLGIMGRTANHKIKKDQVHLHFEIGLKLSDGFEGWYEEKDFGVRNLHGAWNGMNLMGMDPWDFFMAVSEKRVKDISSYIRNLRTGFILRVYSHKVPSFVYRYPYLVDKKIDKKMLIGWDIEFTWYGLPKLWKPLYRREEPSDYLAVFSIDGVSDGIYVSYLDDVEVRDRLAVKTIARDKRGSLVIGDRIREVLKLLFKY